MASAEFDMRTSALKGSAHEESTLLPALKTTARLVPRQLIDELELAKLELGHKKSKVAGVAIFAVLALLFLAVLAVALIVAGIAGLATVLPLWLAALLVSAGVLLIVAICALVAYLQVKSLIPFLPEHAWRGIRYDLGVAREGTAFDPATLDTPPLNKADKKAKKAADEAAAAAHEAEREAKSIDSGPKANQQELIERTGTRREHLTALRSELLEQANVKKQTNYLLDQAKIRARVTVSAAADSVATQSLQTLQARWKPLSVFAVSTAALVVLLRALRTK